MREFISQEQLGSFVDNRFLEGKVDFELPNSVNQKPWKKLTFAKAHEIQQAIHSAAKAFKTFRRTSGYERSRILQAAAEGLLQNKEEFAATMIAEMGKTIREARAEVDYAAGYFSWFAGEAVRIYGQSIPSQHIHKRIGYDYRPVGVCGIITPWNFPIAMIARKVAPAIAAGCTAVVKPSPEAPISVLAMAELFRKCGLPAGVLNVLVGDEIEIGKEMLAANEIRKLSFTGSTHVGQLLYAASAPTLKRTTMELGGLAPLIVFESADLEKALEQTVLAKFRNNGQSCVAANRIFVQESIYKQFTQKFIERVKKLKVGDPAFAETDISLVLHRLSLERIPKQIKDAVSKGAHLALKGETPAYPQVLSHCTRDMLPFQEETFGPLASIASFKTEAEVLEWANESPFGLAAYFFTQDVAQARRAIESLDCGVIGWNDGIPSTPQGPFGGTKHSGFGREGGPTGIYEYLEEQFVSQII